MAKPSPDHKGPRLFLGGGFRQGQVESYNLRKVGSFLHTIILQCPAACPFKYNHENLRVTPKKCNPTHPKGNKALLSLLRDHETPTWRIIPIGKGSVTPNHPHL